VSFTRMNTDELFATEGKRINENSIEKKILTHSYFEYAQHLLIDKTDFVEHARGFFDHV